MRFRVLLSCVIVTIFQLKSSAQVRDSVQLRVTDGVLYGVLTSPKKAVKPPIVLILSDAGGSDRDGNAGMFANNCLKLLSDSLAKRGIASLRFDKRGTGRSAALTDESRLRFTDYAMDAIAWGKWLRKQNRWGRIVMAGHGEGALIGALAANDAGVDGFVSLLGPAEPADTMIIRQVIAQGLKPGPADTVRALFGELRRQGRISAIPQNKFYNDFFRPSVQQYLYTWMQYAPIPAYQSVKAPSLLIAGSADLQQDSAQFIRIRSSVSNAQHLMIAGMNHVLRQAPADLQQNMDTYYDPMLPIDAELLRSLAEFIHRKN